METHDLTTKIMAIMPKITCKWSSWVRFDLPVKRYRTSARKQLFLGGNICKLSADRINYLRTTRTQGFWAVSWPGSTWCQIATCPVTAYQDLSLWVEEQTPAPAR
jgi:hypothetical protein